MIRQNMVPLLLTAIIASTSATGCATDKSNAIMKNRILAMSPGNKQRSCGSGYALTCKSTQGHVSNCYCLDRDTLRDVIPPDPAR